MIIRHCHIDHFGTLQDVDKDFKDGFNSILEDNGTGKSTLAVFISVMLYGFQGEGIRKDREVASERLHYRPWNDDGSYGGTLTFTCGGKTYRIERTFGQKAINDTLAVYDVATNTTTNQFGDVPGEKIFDLDIDSFRNTVFLAQQHCSTSVTDNIRAKIGNVSNETADMGNYDVVQAKLKKASDSLTPERKSGELYKLKDELANLEVTAQSRGIYEQLLDQDNAQLEKLAAQKANVQKGIEETGEALRKMSVYSDLKAKKVQYDNYMQVETTAKEKVENLQKDLPDLVPQEEEITCKIADAKNLPVYHKSAENYAFSVQEETDYRNLSQKFAGGVPAEEDLNRYTEEADRIRALEEKHASLKLSPDEQRRFEAEQAMFANGVPDVDKVNGYIDSWNQRSTLQQDAYTQNTSAKNMQFLMQQQKARDEEDQKRARQEQEDKAMEKKRKAGGSKVLGIVLVVLGAFLLLLGIAAWPLLIPGVILLIFGIHKINAALKMQKEADAETSAPIHDIVSPLYSQYQQQYNECMKRAKDDEQQIREIEATVRAFLEKLQIRTADAKVATALDDVIKKIGDYQTLCERVREQKQVTESESGGTRKQEITNFVRQYLPQSDGSDLAGNLKQIGYDRKHYQNLEEKKQNRQAQEKKEQELKGSLQYYLQSLGIQADDPEQALTTLKEMVQSLKNAQTALAEAANKRQTFAEQHREDLEKLASVQIPEGGPTLEELQQTSDVQQELMEHIQEKMRDINLQKQTHAENLEKAEKAEEDAAADQEKIQKKEHQLRILKLTQGYLQVAKENFSSRYMAQIQDAFRKYYGMINPSGKQSYELDANLNIKVRDNGLHDIRLLSEGYQDLVGLCRRMAMIEAMYDQEKPFLVLDDPFVNLDDKKLAGAKDFLNQIGTEYQVIYFTCQQGRA